MFVKIGQQYIFLTFPPYEKQKLPLNLWTILTSSINAANLYAYAEVENGYHLRSISHDQKSGRDASHFLVSYYGKAIASAYWPETIF